MTIQEALTDLGDYPLTHSPYCQILYAIITAYLPGEEPISKEDTGQALISRIYTELGEEKTETLMSKQLGVVRHRDAYRTTMLGIACSAGFGVISLAVAEMISANDPSVSTGLGLLRQLISSGIDVLFAVVK